MNRFLSTLTVFTLALSIVSCAAEVLPTQADLATDDPAQKRAEVVQYEAPIPQDARAWFSPIDYEMGHRFFFGRDIVEDCVARMGDPELPWPNPLGNWPNGSYRDVVQGDIIRRHFSGFGMPASMWLWPIGGCEVMQNGAESDIFVASGTVDLLYVDTDVYPLTHDGRSPSVWTIDAKATLFTPEGDQLTVHFSNHCRYRPADESSECSPTFDVR